MAGTIASGILSKGVGFAFAGPDDDESIRKLLRENAMQGDVSVTFEREPNYFHGTGIVADADETIVAREGERLICMGSHVRRECWVAGRPAEVGYLAELRLDQRARRRFSTVRDGYQFFRERAEDAFRFTSIASDNERARRFLESGVRGLPVYEFIGELTTVLIEIPRRHRPSSIRLENVDRSNLSVFLELLNQHGRRFQLAAVWTEERLRSLKHHGLPMDRLRLLMEGDNVVGSCGLWDQRGFRQTVVRGYSGWLGVFRPALNVSHGVLRRPALPNPGEVVRQAFLSPFAMAADFEDILPECVEAFFPIARAESLDWLTVSLPAGDSRLNPLLRKFNTRVWSSRLYRVRWPDDEPRSPLSTDLPVLPDVALL